jgi:hypothetical protein
MLSLRARGAASGRPMRSSRVAAHAQHIFVPNDIQHPIPPYRKSVRLAYYIAAAFQNSIVNSIVKGIAIPCELL